MSAESITSASAIVGGGFFGGLLLGYALKKLVKMVAIASLQARENPHSNRKAVTWKIS